MRKFFSVKVNGVAYDVEVEEVVSPMTADKKVKMQTTATLTPETPVVSEQEKNFNEGLKQKNATQMAANTLDIPDSDLVPIQQVTYSENGQAKSFNEQYNELYGSGNMGNTTVLKPPVTVSPANDSTIAMTPISPVHNDEIFDFDSPKFSATAKQSVTHDDFGTSSTKTGKNSVLAPLNGTITAIPIKTGSSVRCGDVLCVIKTGGVESEIMSPIDCEVVGVFVNPGQSVATNDILFTLT